MYHYRNPAFQKWIDKKQTAGAGHLARLAYQRVVV